ncbi:hypothetical protein EW146_g505 [Bondarzewia mesenterica]|uniref:Uncharacterized protein n=1 Tax=Bondarzewia mesenterica TaxID=1095465 RepID=A0A4S4M6N9_9AGAM|nr:hypothetical protein EW146_g505 [Bondarzewia mesenterica]
MTLFEILCCCCRARSDSSASQLDEHTRLIPHTDESDASIPRNAATVDQERLKERLETIVRARAGKMVSVVSPLPFNLHNQSLHQQSDASASRSGRFPSPQPSVDTTQTSDSASAFHDYDHGDEDSRLMLNAKIVRDMGGVAGVPTKFALRDRSRGLIGGVDVHGDGGDGGEIHAEGSGGNMGTVTGSTGPSDLEAQGLEISTAEGHPSSADAFKIQDVGSLSRSWGD